MSMLFSCLQGLHSFHQDKIITLWELSYYYHKNYYFLSINNIYRKSDMEFIYR